jgi:maltokinase
VNGPIDVLRSPAVAEAVARWLPAQRWYADKGLPLARVRLREVLPFHRAGAIALWQAEFRAGPPSLYHVPHGIHPAGAAGTVIARHERWAVTDALADPMLVRALLTRIAAGEDGGALRFGREAADLAPLSDAAAVRPLGMEQSNTSVVVDDRYLLKVFRRPVAGVNTDVDIQRLLAAAGSTETPRLLGTIEAPVDGEPATLAVLQQYLPDAVDGWTFAADTCPGFARHAYEMGRTVARLHGQLAAHGPTAPLGPDAARRIGRSMLDRLDTVAGSLGPLVPVIRGRYADAVAAATASRITLQRVQGDLHLGQMLWAQGRWRVVDFEGEPAATPAERAALHPVVKDIAGMLRSFDYRAFAGVGEEGAVDRGVRGDARVWVDRCRTAFTAGYSAGSGTDLRAQALLLTAYEIDKAVYEVGYELRNRPSWAWIPKRALARLAAHTDASYRQTGRNNSNRTPGFFAV